MIYTVQNKSRSTRIFYDMKKREVRVDPGCVKYAEIDDGTYARLCVSNDIIIRPASFARHAPIQPPPLSPIIASAAKLPISVRGHFGIGDNLHQRAVMRELMKTYDVWLHTCHFNVYHDLVEQGLKLVMRPTSLHAQAKTIAREHQQFRDAKFPAVPSAARQLNIGYPKILVDQHGSILEAMFSCVGLKMPEKPDFRFPVKPEWKARAQERIGTWQTGGKPLMVHRPIVVRKEWNGRSRNPDLAPMTSCIAQFGIKYFVVSIADLAPGREWIEGPEQQADVRLHAGELDFPGDGCTVPGCRSDLLQCGIRAGAGASGRHSGHRGVWRPGEFPHHATCWYPSSPRHCRSM